jgi:Fe-S cluster biogenesis protein NfuA
MAMTLLKGLWRKREEVEERGPLYAQVRDIMSDVQAYARSHGGQIHLLGVSDSGEVKVKMTGACKGCPMSGITLKLGIEMQLRKLVPGVTKITLIS